MEYFHVPNVLFILHSTIFTFMEYLHGMLSSATESSVPPEVQNPQRQEPLDWPVHLAPNNHQLQRVHS
eukprot:COSAG02_NODE_356_length_23978_cov_7.868504_3_plen_68_part_00